MTEKKYPKDKPPKHATVRIPKPIVRAIEEFLNTQKAKQMGYIHKVDVVTDAVRKLLEKYGYYEEIGESPRE
jgi:Arc/MetJ-type ribon-helix-helix transcriptional regulator